jgi:hypothetical protein
MVDAPVVLGAIEAHSVGFVHVPSIGVRGAHRKRRCDRDPALLRDGHGPDFVGNHGEILVLAEQDGNVVGPSRPWRTMSSAKPHVHVLLLPDEHGRGRAVG